MATLYTKFCGYLLAALSAFFLPITWALTSVTAIVIIDTILGVMAAGKEDVRNITSRKLSAVVGKIIFYLSSVIIGRIGELFIDDRLPLVKLVLLAVLIIEVKSIDENGKKLFGFSFLDKVLEAMKMIKRK